MPKYITKALLEGALLRSLQRLTTSARLASVADPDPNLDPDPPDPHVLGLPDPDPLLRGMAPDPTPDPDPSIIMQNSKKNLDFYYFVTLFDFLSLKNYVNVPSKNNKLKILIKKICFLLAS
jgi:hypothetical protein